MSIGEGIVGKSKESIKKETGTFDSLLNILGISFVTPEQRIFSGLRIKYNKQECDIFEIKVFWRGVESKVQLKQTQIFVLWLLIIMQGKPLSLKKIFEAKNFVGLNQKKEEDYKSLHSCNQLIFEIRGKLKLITNGQIEIDNMYGRGFYLVDKKANSPAY